jgi:hypothetical protein
MDGLIQALSEMSLDEWVVATQGSVALATLMLAGVTTWMAIQARRAAIAAEDEVKLTRRVAESSERALLTQVQPILSDYPRNTLDTEVSETYNPWLNPEDFPLVGHVAVSKRSSGPDQAEAEEWVISVPLFNIGSGVAVIRDAWLTVHDQDLRGLTVLSQAMLPPRERARVVMKLGASQFGEESLGLAWPFSVNVSYCNIHGDGALVSTFEIHWRRGGWHIERVDLLSEQSQERVTGAAYIFSSPDER